MIRGLSDGLKALQGGMLTLDALAQVGLLEAEEVDGKKQYKPKGSTTPAGAPAPKARADDDPLFQRVKTLEAQLEKARKDKEVADTAVTESSRDNAIIEALREAGAVNPQRDFMHLKSKVLKGDTGYFAKGVDEAGYEVEVKLPDLVKEFLKTNPELRRAVTQGGAGSPAGGQQGQGAPNLRPGQQVVPKTQWSNMDWFMNNRAKFATGEFLRGQ